MFKKRWNELSYAKGPAFELGLEEQRALYRFLLTHPPADEQKPATPLARTEQVAFHAEQYRLRKIEELAHLDPEYPADLARGVALYRIGRYPQATERFATWVEAHPDGPYAQRARNYWRASLARSHEDL
jgi:TolA-binding protein